MVPLYFDMILSHRSRIFDGPQSGPNYQPPPEDRPGGFDWGQGRQVEGEGREGEGRQGENGEEN